MRPILLRGHLYIVVRKRECGRRNPYPALSRSERERERRSPVPGVNGCVFTHAGRTILPLPSDGREPESLELVNAEHAGRQDSRAESAATAQCHLGAEAERLIHPVAGSALLRADETHAANFKFLADERAQIHAAREDVSAEDRRRTLLNSTYLLVSIIGLWAGSVYVPASVTHLASKAGLSEAEGARLASYGTMLLSAGTILGCLVLPVLAERYGRRVTLGLYFAVMLVFISVGFGYVFYLREGALGWFMACLFFLGVGGANFAMYTLWLPEQYRTECRASAFAFSTSVGRFVGAGVTFLVGAGVAHFGTIGTPVALTSIAFAAGLLLLPLGEETKGKPLPA